MRKDPRFKVGEIVLAEKERCRVLGEYYHIDTWAYWLQRLGDQYFLTYFEHHLRKEKEDLNTAIDLMALQDRLAKVETKLVEIETFIRIQHNVTFKKLNE